jgi:sporulation protein YabP
LANAYYFNDWRDSMESAKNVKNHVLHIDSRQKVDITGVTKVIAFNEDNVILSTVLGVLNIKGKNMKMNKLNVDNGDMSIEGEVVSFAYTSKDVEKKESMLKKLFK